MADHELSSLRDLNHYRSRDVGMVFQLHNLLPTLTAAENVQVPMFEVGRSARERRERARRLLTLVGLAGKEDQRPTELSGGERQRVAIARALANEPPLLLADEPTGALDHASATALGQLLVELNKEEGVTLIVVTHAMDLAKRMARLLTLTDGRLQ